MTRNIRFKKCDKIYKELEAKHCKIVYDSSNTFTYHGWTSSAREIEADLYSNYLLKDKLIVPRNIIFLVEFVKVL